jgi:outer membrane protein
VRATAGGRRSIGAFLLAALVVVSALIPDLVWAQAAASAPDQKIGYADFKRLIDNAPQMVESQGRLQKEFSARDQALSADEARLATLRQRYDRDGSIMSKPDAEALKREIDSLERSIKRGRDELHTDFNTRALAERDKIWQEINNAVVEYAHANGYDLVVTSPVVYASPRIDITDAVLDRLRRAKPATPKP